ncbi:MAG TPA: saccharopine dehydrogenase C-terminal domain-containing protein [Vicinamibacterales bacterium]|nr:saccharopine dehydrogenase C-terminal domain-containing protein [Vicinamibacterales bacterium]
MGFKYVVIGAGRQGVAAAYDLGVFGRADEIVLLDIDGSAAEAAAGRLNQLLGRRVARGAAADAGDIRALRPYLQDATGCISSVHFTFNLAITRLAIEQRVNLTDFGGNTEVVRQQLELDPEARAAGIAIVPDCGMGPGLNVSLATYVMSLIEEPREVLIWDGGLPQDPRPPWNYACAFALGGLTNEYAGDAYFLRDGGVTPAPCFSGYETLEFPPPIGTLEAFVTSGGLSTAPWTFEGKLQRLENKTLRYPGHAAQFKAFSDLGLLDLDPINAGGQRVVPRDVFHALLAPRIQRGEDFRDVCVMRVHGRGETRGRDVEAVVELVDWYDEQRGFTAMQRLTGWHGSIMLIAAIERRVRPGVVSVETAVPGKTVVDECLRRGLSVKTSAASARE